MVHGAALEKRSPLQAERGFESHPLRQKSKSINFITCPTNRGEVLEWSIRRAWRARVAFGYRGFESHPLRHSFLTGTSLIILSNSVCCEMA